LFAPPVPDGRSQARLVQAFPRRCLVEFLDVGDLHIRGGDGAVDLLGLGARPVGYTFERARDLSQIRSPEKAPASGSRKGQEGQWDQEPSQPPARSPATRGRASQRGPERLGLRLSPRLACRGEPVGDEVQVGDERRRARVPGRGVLRQKLENHGV